MLLAAQLLAKVIANYAKEMTCKTADLTFLGQQRSSEILDELKFESILASWRTLGWIPEARMISYLW